MLEKNTEITVNQNALVQKVSDEMVILDSESGQYYTLNEMATKMLEHAQSGKTLGEIVLSICDEYDASEQEVEQDLKDMIAQLLDKGLVRAA
ncbi:HPr-rel-A system PqqD family peptide chaperone [Ningiella sp. W23]|uniref:HPr-rel-A system PqqD family peptide chaperone n=1 Tax=Ningiella sp. W23 TaxID=3023715 RepID=UPI003757E13C